MTLTPEQFDKLATKEDLKNIFYSWEELDKIFDKVITAVDGVATMLDDIKQRLVSNQAAHDRFEERITKTEDQLHLRPVLEKV